MNNIDMFQTFKEYLKEDVKLRSAEEILDCAVENSKLIASMANEYYSEDKNITSLFDIKDVYICEHIRDEIQWDNKNYTDSLLSQTLKYYANFLDYIRIKEERALRTKKKSNKDRQHETPQEREITEGERRHIELESSYRNPKLRQACIDKYGYICQVCGMNFAELYGEELGANFIEVHHLKMISTYEEERPEDYIENLVPLCSNCHSMIHKGKNGPLSLTEIRAAYKGPINPIPNRKE